MIAHLNPFLYVVALLFALGLIGLWHETRAQGVRPLPSNDEFKGKGSNFIKALKAAGHDEKEVCAIARDFLTQEFSGSEVLTDLASISSCEIVEELLAERTEFEKKEIKRGEGSEDKGHRGKSYRRKKWPPDCVWYISPGEKKPHGQCGCYGPYCSVN